ncbi:MAG: PIN domain-containing protein [Bifidobacteriaceae bacterium]|nr:PIN domain-containing protein [Bifidobacteriaceae bacterium]
MAAVIYVDASVLIHARENDDALGQAAREALASASEPLGISALTRMECLVGPLRRHDPDLEADYRATFESLVRVPIDDAVFERAARLRADKSVGAQDAIHWAAALAAGCSALLTADPDLADRAAPFAVRVQPPAATEETSGTERAVCSSPD